jgi:hypothetical protein
MKTMLCEHIWYYFLLIKKNQQLQIEADLTGEKVNEFKDYLINQSISFAKRKKIFLFVQLITQI